MPESTGTIPLLTEDDAEAFADLRREALARIIHEHSCRPRNELHE